MMRINPNSFSSGRAALLTFVLTILLSFPTFLTAQCDADAGGFSAQQLCLQNSDVVLQATPAGDAVVPTGFQVLYVLTGGDSLIILQVSEEPSFTLEDPAGLFTLHTLVYNPNTLDLSIVVPGATTGLDVNGLLIQGGGSICASLDVTGAKFNFGGCDDGCPAEAGTLTAGSSVILVDSTVTLTATIEEAPAVPTGYEVLYVLTSGENLVIEQVASEPSFTVNRTGRFTIHTLVYDPNTLDLSIVVPGQTTGVDVVGLLIQGGGDICAALDVTGAPINVTECTADAGTLTADGDAILVDGSATLTATRDEDPVVPMGYEVLYVLTSGENLVIEQVASEPSFTVNRTGRFTIHTLVYDPNTLDLSIVVRGQTTGVDVVGLLIQGGGDICAALDVTGAPINVTECTADAGTLVPVAGACLEDGSATLTAERGGEIVVPDSYEVLYVLTSGENLVIEQVGAEPTFTVERTGRFTIHTLVYDPNTLDLSIVVPGQTTGVDVVGLLIQGGGDICAALDVTGAPFDIEACTDACDADAGTLKAVQTGVCIFTNDGTATLEAKVVKAPVVPVGFEVLYVLTSGEGLVIEQVSTTPSFSVEEFGKYTIHTLVYDPNTLDLSIVVPGETTGFDVNSLLIQGGGDICASLDVTGAPIEVSDCRCAADAGRLTYTSGRGQVCLINNKVVLAANTLRRPFIPRGYQKIYVLTSGNNLVIEQVNHIPVFAVDRTGIFTIHTLVYNPATLNLGIVVPGQTTGFDVNSLLIQGGGDICASLDVTGARFTVRDCGSYRISPYPNPASDYVNLELPKIQDVNQITIEIVDVFGNIVQQQQLDGKAELTKLDISTLRSGNYFIKVLYDQELIQQTTITKMK